MRAFDLTVSGSLILSGSMKNQDGNSIVSNSAQIGSNISGSLGANAAVIRTLDRTTLSGSLGANAAVIRSLNRTTISGSIPQPLATNSSPTFAAGTITGDFSVGGILTAQEVHTEFESASILFTSGSTRSGDDTTDTHRVTGSMDISGSLNIPHGDLIVTDNIGIGTNNASFKLDITENAETNVVRFFNDGGDSNRDVMILQGGADAGPGNTRFITFNDGNGGAFGFIQGPAASATAGISFNTTADTSLLTLSGSRVGIGTVNPDSELHVVAAGSPSIRVTDTTNTVTGKFQTDNSVGKVGTQTNHSFELFSNNTNAVTINTSQQVSFASRVTLSNDGSDHGLFLGGGWQIFDNASESFGTTGDLIFYHGASRVVMTDTGEVGIGTTSPDATLDLRGTQKIQTNTVPASIIVGTNDTTDHTGQDTALCIDFRNLSTTNGVAGGIVGLDKDGLELSKILLVTDNHDANTSSIRMFTSTNAAQRTQMVNINNDGMTVGGSASAQRALHVQSSTGICLSDGDRDRVGLRPISPDANTGHFAVNVRSGGSSIERLRLTSTGNLCVGPSGSSAGFTPALTVTGTNPSLGLRLQDGNSGTFYNTVLSSDGNSIKKFYSQQVIFATAANDDS